MPSLFQRNGRSLPPISTARPGGREGGSPASRGSVGHAGEPRDAGHQEEQYRMKTARMLGNCKVEIIDVPEPTPAENE
ncbi:MAG TPA: hypothetical protein QGH10_08640, partial [Armatimonadota bacterium]|nr:hypothetical protein [Armatimonadota bacterium]